LAKLIKRLRRHRVRYSITIRQTKTVRAAIAQIPEQARVPIACQPDGVAEVAETGYRGDRLIVRRGPQPRRPGPAVSHLALPRVRHQPRRRHHLAGRRPPPPRRLRAGHPRPGGGRRGLAHLPSGRFAANAAWLLAAAMGHEVLRWTARLGLGSHGEQLVAKTLRRTLLALPDRLTRSGQ
jgi:hypothetical protein